MTIILNRITIDRTIAMDNRAVCPVNNRSVNDTSDRIDNR
jgi:hypothetical protein